MNLSLLTGRPNGIKALLHFDQNVNKNNMIPFSKIFLLTVSLWIIRVICLVFVMLWRLLIAALRSPAGKGLISWLLFVMFNCDFVTFPCGILGQVWYLIVSIPDLCRLSLLMFINFSYFHKRK